MNRHIATLFVFAAFTVGCHKQPPDSSNVTATIQPAAMVPKTEPQALAALKQNFQRVNFEYDSARLTEDGKTALRQNAEILKAYPDVQVEVQGHCDERGTIEYNLALGQKRAETVRDYLGAHGVPKGRVTTLSFGEERPLVNGNGESAWAQNRRAEFRIRSGSTASIGGTTF